MERFGSISPGRLIRAVVASTALATSAVGTPAAWAQVATPPPLPVVPDPAGCVAEPRSVEEIVALAAAPAVGSGAATAVSVEEEGGSFTPPSGEPAERETVSAVEDAMRAFFACYNAGDLARLFALYSDGFIARDFAGASADDLAFIEASPAALPADQRATLVAVREVRTLADGRVGAFVDVVDPASERPAGEVDFFFLVEEDGRYRIDGFVVVSELATPAP